MVKMHESHSASGTLITIFLCSSHILPGLCCSGSAAAQSNASTKLVKESLIADSAFQPAHIISIITMLLQMIWVCILCRKKQELLIKTGTWMQSTAEMSSDPILRRMEQDMAATPTLSLPPHLRSGGNGSELSTPQNHPASPAASTISSLFSKAMSFAGTPTMPPGGGRPRPQPTNNLVYSGRGRGGGAAGGISRQRSLDSSDSGLSPCGYPSSMRPQSRLGMAPPPLSRHRSEGGDQELQDQEPSVMSGGEATPTATAPFPISPSSTYQRQSPRFRPSAAVTSVSMQQQRGASSTNASGRGNIMSPASRPYLTRGRSLGESPTSAAIGVSSSISFHNRPVTSSVAATPIRSTFIEGVSFTPPNSTSRDRLHIESMSAPEDAYHEPLPPSSLYPRVLVSDSEARDICPPLSDNLGLGVAADKSRLMDPRSIRTTTTRRKLDSTFRNDSLSSDQSECLQQQRPPPPKPHKHKKEAGQPTPYQQRGSGRPFGVSSSDEEIRSTPECTSCGEEEMESESVSEKGRTSKQSIICCRGIQQG